MIKINTVVAGFIAMSAMGASANAQDFVKGRLLIKFKEGTTEAEIGDAIGKSKGSLKKSFPALGLKLIEFPANANEKALANAFKQRSDVEFAEPDYLYASASTPNDPSFNSQWHLSKIASPQAWDFSTGSSTVIIAILDSGVAAWHPDLANQMVPGWNFYNNNSDTNDVFGHGTKVAGVAAAATNNLTGISGVGYNCKIMPLRISDPSGMASASNMAAALQWAADRGVRVANLSFAASGSSTVTSAAQYFMNKGGVVTMSSGNSATVLATADTPYVLTVSATNSGDGMSSFSNTGNLIDCAAPGEGIYTTTMDGGYAAVSGTSFSAPIVAGIAGLMLAANPNLSGAQCYELLRKSGDDLGSAGWDSQYGWGRVNASKAVIAAIGTTGQDTIAPTVSFASPGNGNTISGTATVSINADDNNHVDQVKFYVGSQLVGTKYAAPYSWSWDSNGVADGSQTLKAVAYDLAGNSSQSMISVTVRNTNDTTAPSVVITSPANGTRIGAKLNVSVSASDNIGVTKVELYMDGVLMGTDTAAGYSFSLNPKRISSGTHSLVAKAYDAAGNVASSTTVSFTK